MLWALERPMKHRCDPLSFFLLLMIVFVLVVAVVVVCLFMLFCVRECVRARACVVFRRGFASSNFSTFMVKGPFPTFLTYNLLLWHSISGIDEIIETGMHIIVLHIVCKYIVDSQRTSANPDKTI